MDIHFPIAIFVLLISLVVHEFAHGWAALQLGDDTALRMGRLTFNPMAHLDPIGSVAVPVFAMMLGGFLYGWAKPVPVNPMRFRNPLRDHAIVAAAGPLSNLLLALICAILLGLITGLADNDPELLGGRNGLYFLGLLFTYGISLNVLLALFNLIPIPPLDGSWILMTFLRGEAARRYYQIRPYGILIIILMMSTWLGGVFRLGMIQVGGIYFGIVDLINGLLT